MNRCESERTQSRRLLVLGWLVGALSVCLVASGAFAAAPASDVQDMSSILGPGSQLQAAKDGEFTIGMGADGQFDTFRAVKDVVVITEDINCLCDELIYHRAQGTLTATARAGSLVRITLRNMAAGAMGGGQKGDTYATCRRYIFHINEQRHELSLDPVIYRRDEKGKETAISGDLITMTQDKTGRWQMFVKGNPQIYDPKDKNKLKDAREKLLSREPGAKPVLSIDADPRKEAPKAAPGPAAGVPGPGPGAPPRPVKIDEGSVEKLKPEKSSRIMKIESGG